MGTLVGVHGFAHDRLFSLRGSKRVRADLERAIRVLENITGKTPLLFRPPIGHTNPTIARVADRLDLTMVGWSVRARDGLARTKPEDVLARISRGLEDGAIVLLHDAPEHGTRKPAGVTALPCHPRTHRHEEPHGRSTDQVARACQDGLNKRRR